jgi:hypothetical protein
VPFNEFHSLPPGLLECEARELEGALGLPSLIHLPGGREPALFVSVLLHGNEPSGWNGLRRLLADHPELPRSMSIFVGNVQAARAGMRALPGQQDFNRVWRGAGGVEGEMARGVAGRLAERRFLAAVDLHNNTGHNPHYSVLSDLSVENLGMAYLFCDKAVLIEEPDTVITHLFAGRCPAVTLELGPVSDPECEIRAYDYLLRCLRLDAVPAGHAEDFSLYRSEARVHVPLGVSFHFADEGGAAPLVLTGGVEGVNFHELPAGFRFGSSEGRLEDVLRVLDGAHQDVTERYFALQDGAILLKRPVVPAMYTTDPYVVHQDCLCYLMQRLEHAP